MPPSLVKSLLETNHRLEQELARLKTEIEKKEAEIIRLQARVQDLEMLKVSLDTQLRNADERIKKLEAELKEHSEKLGKLRKTPAEGPFIAASKEPLKEPSLGELMLKERQLKRQLKELGETV